MNYCYCKYCLFYNSTHAGVEGLEERGECHHNPTHQTVFAHECCEEFKEKNIKEART